MFHIAPPEVYRKFGDLGALTCPNSKTKASRAVVQASLDDEI